MKKMVFTFFGMGATSLFLLLFLSILTYTLKWKADTVLIGITFIYIVTGLVGGKIKARMSYDTGIGRKLLDGIWLGNLFMVILIVISYFVMKNEIAFESRFITIWLLMVGSTALGRIL